MLISGDRKYVATLHERLEKVAALLNYVIYSQTNIKSRMVRTSGY